VHSAALIGRAQRSACWICGNLRRRQRGFESGPREQASNLLMISQRQTVLCALLALLYATTPMAKNLVVGDPAPDFTATTLDGKKLTLADFKGQVLIINFWATWCTPCKKELPLLNAYYVLQQVHGLRVLTVTTENSAPINLLRPVAAAVSFPMVRYLRGPYQVMTGVPTNYVIDRHGVLAYAGAGAFDLNDLNQILVPLLKQSITDASPVLAPTESGPAEPQSPAP
jgi:cytochrome c biogenesis protein CcmG, thiol:disulfide interchange protein DsbE